MEQEPQELLDKIKQLEEELAREKQSRKNAAAMAERQKQHVQKLQSKLKDKDGNIAELTADLLKMGTELQTLQPGWRLQQ